MANRWIIASAGTALQLCLGSVYAWSYFQKPLAETYNWTNSQVAWVFSLAICFLGLAAAWGGLNLTKFSPRQLALTGAILFSAGHFLAGAALHYQSLALLYIGYGIIGGIGLGLGYVTPVATVAKWFPDKKGLVTGLVVMGFGFGALLMSKIIAPALVSTTNGNLVMVFLALGVIFGIAASSAALFLKNPPADLGTPASLMKTADKNNKPSAWQHIFSTQFILMWCVFFCNITAGIAIISFQSPLLQDLLKRTEPLLSTPSLAAAGATLIATSSLFNGLGRLLWGGLSDRIGRVQTFRLMLLTQVVAFFTLILANNPWLFGAMVCYVLLCYGGGFGTMPSFVLDVFGSKLMPLVYGMILTAWSTAGIAGPQIVAFFRDNYPAHDAQLSFSVGTGLLILGLFLTLGLSNHPPGPIDRP